MDCIIRMCCDMAVNSCQGGFRFHTHSEHLKARGEVDRLTVIWFWEESSRRSHMRKASQGLRGPYLCWPALQPRSYCCFIWTELCSAGNNSSVSCEQAT